ncbi:hypothetical protein [Segnochrobactrum spirostomi]|uniref:Uncharacterized protein n=1 Tax=Segnochrobactrum spirostomi TaxID=2608987 RepID=A0A6A7Y4L3_9HYPH|nr:hypothetical protein [Segnochrobactrum spirostomi]MQT12682.1 hypothetical protein [Segnochrobactrum spirostomi]
MMTMNMNGEALALNDAALNTVTGGSLSWFSDIGDELSGWVCDMSRTVSSVGSDILEGGAGEAAAEAGAEGAEAGSCLGPVGAVVGGAVAAGIGYLAYKFF